MCKQLSKFEKIRARTSLTDSGAFEPGSIQNVFYGGTVFPWLASSFFLLLHFTAEEHPMLQEPHLGCKYPEDYLVVANSLCFLQLLWSLVVIRIFASQYIHVIKFVQGTARERFVVSRTAAASAFTMCTLLASSHPLLTLSKSHEPVSQSPLSSLQLQTVRISKKSFYSEQNHPHPYFV